MIKYLVKYMKHIKLLMLLVVITAFIRSIVSVRVPIVIQGILNEWINQVPTEKTLVSTLILLFSLVSIRVLANLINISSGRKLEARLSKVLMKESVSHINRLSMTVHDKESLGGFLSRAISDVETFTSIVYEAPNAILSSILMIIGSTAAMYSIKPSLTLIILIIVPLYVLLNVYVGPLVRKSQYKIRKDYSDILKQVESAFSSIKLIKLFNQYDYMEKRVDKSLGAYEEKFSRQGIIIGSYKSGFLFLRESIRILVVVFGGYLLVRGQLQVGDIVAFQLLTMSFLRPVDGLLSIVPSILKAYGSFDRYKEMVDLEEEKNHQIGINAPLEGHIQFKNLSFSYENVAYKKVLDDISLEILPGEHIGFVGETGCGKSTLLALLMRLYEVENQMIYFDQRDINDYSFDTIRDSIGLVQQDVTIFDGTIKENLLMAKPNASEQEIIQALFHAKALGFVEEFEDQLDALVGSRGVLLSGGQCQRLALARLFLKDPKIILLDEATSALDNQTEKSVQSALSKLLENRTTITVAHRLSTVEDCDRIYMFENGRIIESGSHEELLSEEKSYYNLYMSISSIS
ncbi:ABC transporter ATP-binding protein [Acidaminobacter sp. JC074]|uniref:ABC transporter ATP-binding protein n=1 Tax=Acidaminobacter sp. JC074 TaxID=2530199 RepID=UPI001F0D0144|nr:ABC transporter ATP-binding protein [Acidaminobacter sp. JC074]MCH4891048.1 ABC transporter ATP-binding protein [Acidaminobacter sp. JC074]